MPWWNPALIGIRPTSPLSRSGSRAQAGNDSQGSAAKGNAVIPFPSQRAAGRVSWTYNLLFTVANAPQNGPAFRVPAGCVVRVNANNGTSAGNSGMVFVSTDPGSLRNKQGRGLAPLDDVAFQTDNTYYVWAMGAIGDGVVISVQTQQ